MQQDPLTSWAVVIVTIGCVLWYLRRRDAPNASPNVPAYARTMPTMARATTPMYPDTGHAMATRGDHQVQLRFELGKGADGHRYLTNLADKCHVLVAGSTQSGKSTFVRGMITDLLTQYAPCDLRLVLIDPKRVELADFADAPHTIACVYEVEDAIQVLEKLCVEMEQRYMTLQSLGVRTIDEVEGLPRIVVVIEELANLMLARGKKAEIERLIVRLASMSRAVGVHLVLVTQRPSVDVVTGAIKTNIPTRVCLSVPSQVDSRVILDVGGGEKLLGNGDMLVRLPGRPGTIHLQGKNVSKLQAYASTREWV